MIDTLKAIINSNLITPALVATIVTIIVNRFLHSLDEKKKILENQLSKIQLLINSVQQNIVLLDYIYKNKVVVRFNDVIPHLSNSVPFAPSPLLGINESFIGMIADYNELLIELKFFSKNIHNQEDLNEKLQSFLLHSKKLLNALNNLKGLILRVRTLNIRYFFAGYSILQDEFSKYCDYHRYDTDNAEFKYTASK